MFNVLCRGGDSAVQVTAPGQRLQGCSSQSTLWQNVWLDCQWDQPPPGAGGHGVSVHCEGL